MIIGDIVMWPSIVQLGGQARLASPFMDTIWPGGQVCTGAPGSTHTGCRTTPPHPLGWVHQAGQLRGRGGTMALQSRDPDHLS
ncbi:hypothetical protein Pcinc_027163 [Petrolisthes cinctipes]|uniref:Uncharacterized protein n=1 Tax=Petrolisthes cinctipes TaxID=88211 RepID=A0AAE1F4V9_PETCI|nr:hypothetical protein Pcinc_027163 [Petrolisthes cinctipes]